MTFPKARLAVSACLLIAWLAYLGFLVYETRNVVVLSKPQLMVAETYAVVEVRDQDGRPNPEVEIVSASSRHGEVLMPAKVELPDLSVCTKEQGYQGPGKYLVPLNPSPNGYVIVAVPRIDPYGRQALTHGTVEAFGVFSHRVRRRLPLVEARQLQKEWEEAGYKTSLLEEEIRIYPWTPETEAQLKAFTAAMK